MTSYAEFLEKKQFQDVASGFEASDIHPLLFPFQKDIVRWALRRGRAGVYADTGLGKTFMQCECAAQVHDYTGGNVLILAPLCVAQQTVEEAAKLDIVVNYCREQSQVRPGITITNYEMLHHFDPSAFVCVILDESSILKNQDGKTRTLITEAFRKTPYRFSFTATPSPNDHMELGTQAEFLGIMSATEMMACFFTHDGGDTSKWRLKGHGKTKFWEWMSTWAVVIRKPSDLGYSDDGYELPPLNIHEHVVEAEFQPEGQLFATVAQTLAERRVAKKQSIDDRVAQVAEMVNASDEQWIVWCHLNDESAKLTKAIPDAIEVTGSMSMAEKERGIMSFVSGQSRVIVGKPSIFGFGLNLQRCHNMAFVGLNDSYEEFYQSIRRCYRFGQDKPVNVHIVCAEGEGAVRANIERKQAQAEELTQSMVEHMRDLMQRKVKGAMVEKSEYKRNKAEGNGWTLHLGDCIDVAGELETDSIDYTIFSPPFASLYTYSNSDRDMGNSRDHGEFYNHFRFLVGEMLRITKPGRLISFHCMNLPTSKQNDGFIGLRDFRGELIRMFVEAGWIYHSEVCIWKDPVTAMQRTKAIGLLYKQLKKDSCMSRQGIPDYLVTMRKPGENPDRVTKDPNVFGVDRWQRYASPVWMDINPSRTLQFRSARDGNDERHICPLQLDVIERAVELWTNPNDLVFSPFTGIGSEGHVALQMGRRFVGSELKESYFNLARRNLDDANRQQTTMFEAV